jgi:CRP/FNR family transcriptional regulator
MLCEVADEDPPPRARLAPDGLPAAVRVPLRTGARLFEAGAPGGAVYVVQSGIVKEVMHCPDGSECIVRLVVRGGVCGLGALLQLPHHHSAYVIHPGQACRIPVERLQRLRAKDPDAVDRLFADWQQAVDDADRIISEFGQGPARARLARALLYLREMLAPDEPLRVKRDDLAQLMAVNPTTVARLLGEFRREGLLQQRGRYCVGIDRARLNALSLKAA